MAASCWQQLVLLGESKSAGQSVVSALRQHPPKFVYAAVGSTDVTPTACCCRCQACTPCSIKARVILTVLAAYAKQSPAAHLIKKIKSMSGMNAQLHAIYMCVRYVLTHDQGCTSQ